jgi:hypothetical protein
MSQEVVCSVGVNLYIVLPVIQPPPRSDDYQAQFPQVLFGCKQSAFCL